MVRDICWLVLLLTYTTVSVQVKEEVMRTVHIVIIHVDGIRPVAVKYLRKFKATRLRVHLRCKPSKRLNKLRKCAFNIKCSFGFTKSSHLGLKTRIWSIL